MDLFRTTHRNLSPAETELIQALKAKANEMGQLLNRAQSLSDPCPERARGIATARTNLQQAVFWGTYGITAEK